MDLNGNHDLSFCDGCVYGKHYISFPLSEGFHAKEICRLVHINLCGPMAITFHGRAKYFLTFIDDFSEKTCLYTMETKFVCLTSLRFSKFW
jgi:hypothetical protein